MAKTEKKPARFHAVCMRCYTYTVAETNSRTVASRAAGSHMEAYGCHVTIIDRQATAA